MTVDSFCAGGEIQPVLINYTNIKSAIAYENADMFNAEECNSLCYGITINNNYYESSDVVNSDELSAREEDDLFGTDLKCYKALAKFLNFVKDL